MWRTPRLAVAAASLTTSVLLAATGCNARAPAGHRQRPAGELAATSTGWIPPGPALPTSARVAAAPNLVAIRTTEANQPLDVYRMTSRPFAATVPARIVPPAGQAFGSISAAGDDRTFLATAAGASIVGRIAPVRFYEFRLNRAGKPGRLIPLKFRLPRGLLLGALTLSPDGSQIAAASRTPTGTGLVVIATATGRVREWTWHHRPAPSAVGWSGDHAVDFATTAPVGTTGLASSLYRLNTQPSGTNLTGARRLHRTLIRFGGLTGRSPWAVTQLTITADGRTAFVALSSGSGDATHQVLVSINAITGKPLAVIDGPLVGWSHDGLYCDLLWTDGSGRHLLVSCRRFGRIDSGRFTTMRFLATSATAYFPPTLGAPFAWGG